MKKQTEDIFEPAIPVVPQGWDVLPFDQAVDVVSDKSKRIKQSAYLPSGKLPVIDQGQEFIGGYTDDEDMAFEGELPVILFGDHTRSIKYVDRPFAVGAEGVKILKPSSGFDPKYLYYLLRSLQIPSRGYSRHFQFLRKFHFPRAPESQQKHIVAEIEKQFSRLDEAVANLKRVKANLKRYKAAVLKAAVEGRLTDEWRKAHPKVAPTSRLLEQILAKRRSTWEEAELAKMKVKGKKPRDDKWKKEYEGPFPITTNISLPEIPETWAWASVDQIGTVGEQPALTGPFGSHLGKEDFRTSGVPVLTIGCLQEEGIQLENAMYISEKKASELSRYRLRDGDMLFSRMAAVGRAGFVTKELEGAIFNYHIMRLRLSTTAIDPNYFVSYVRGAKSVMDYVREVNHGATRDGINTDQLLSMPVALPPADEQQQIIAEIEERISVVLEIERQIETNLLRGERLRQSVLARAFSGSLIKCFSGLSATLSDREIAHG